MVRAKRRGDPEDGRAKRNSRKVSARRWMQILRRGVLEKIGVRSTFALRATVDNLRLSLM
jgi:hypothetical protein